MRPILLILAVAATQLGGCLGDDAPVGSASVAPPASDDARLPVDDAGRLAALHEVAAPAWSVGDSWRFTSTDGTTGTLVVVAASSSTYTLATDEPTLASYDAVFDVSYIGAIRATDLAGAQQGSPVKFFDFPLSNGKTWTAAWDGLEVELTATARADGGFDIAGTAAGAPYVAYDYTPSLKWWSHLDFDGYGIKVSEHRSNWTGSYVVATAETLLELGTGGAPAGAFAVAEGQTSVLLATAGASQAVLRARAIVDPAGQPFLGDGDDVTFSPNPWTEWGVLTLPPTPGEWRIAMPTAQDPSGWWSAEIHQVAVASASL